MSQPNTAVGGVQIMIIVAVATLSMVPLFKVEVSGTDLSWPVLLGFSIPSAT